MKSMKNKKKKYIKNMKNIWQQHKKLQIFMFLHVLVFLFIFWKKLIFFAQMRNDKFYIKIRAWVAKLLLQITKLQNYGKLQQSSGSQLFMCRFYCECLFIFLLASEEQST